MSKRTLKSILKTMIVIDICLFFAGLIAVMGMFIVREAKKAGFWPKEETLVADGGTKEPTVTMPPSAAERPEIVAVKSDATSIHIEWKTNSATLYFVEYRTGQDDWVRKQTKETHMDITGLLPDTMYEIRVDYSDGYEEKEYVASFSEKTYSGGYGDPFEGIGANLYVGGEKKSVIMTKATGCLEADAWPQIKSNIYGDPTLTSKIGELGGGNHVNISADIEGHYAYLRNTGRWSVYVSDGNGKVGWIDADALIIDLQDIFSAKGNIYSIQYDRTNAYSSIFTVGGSVAGVDKTSAQESRYWPIKDKDNIFSSGGYNVIPGVTGNGLPNYGSREQMPVIWCLGTELIQCQKNALNNGCCLIIYDGYRPGSTSKTVNNIVRSEQLLSRVEYGRSLANGFLNTHFSEGNFIANTSKHNKAIAVDLSMMKYESIHTIGDEMRMQTKMHTLDFRAHMSYNNAAAALLYSVMTTKTSLVALSGKQEWWHFELENNEEKFPLINKYVFADYRL